MPRLNENSTPAERARGCVFAETFESAAKVVLNGGTVTGTPVIDFGVTLTAAVDHVEYGLTNELDVTDEGFVLEFTPTFEHDDSANRYIFDTDGDRFYVLKNSSNQLSVSIAGTSLNLISAATLGAVWLTNERNVLVVAGTSGATKVWLNGVEILDAAVAWSVSSVPTNIRFGDKETGSSFPYLGSIKSFRTFKQILTAQEAQDYYDNSTYDYRNQAVLDLRMGLAQHDPTNARTLDLARGGNHATVSGATKLTDRAGFDFDGTADYLVGTGTGIFNTAEVGIAIEFTPDFATDEDVDRYLFDSTIGSRYFALKRDNANSNTLILWLADTSIVVLAEATYSPYWNVGGRNVLIISGTTGDTSAWLNGNQILANDNTAWSGANPANLTIGSQADVTDFFDGYIHRFRVWQRLITPLQMHDIGITMRKQVNDN